MAGGVSSSASGATANPYLSLPSDANPHIAHEVAVEMEVHFGPPRIPIPGTSAAAGRTPDEQELSEPKDTSQIATRLKEPQRHSVAPLALLGDQLGVDARVQSALPSLGKTEQRASHSPRGRDLGVR